MHVVPLVSLLVLRVVSGNASPAPTSRSLYSRFPPGVAWRQVACEVCNPFEGNVCERCKTGGFSHALVNIPWSRHHVLTRLCFLYRVSLEPLPRIGECVCGFVSGLLLLCHRSKCLFSCQCRAVLMTVNPEHSLKAKCDSPASFLLRTALAIQGVLWTHIKFAVFLL